MKELNVMIQNGIETLTVLQGQALEQKPPQKIDINGDIHAVKNFLLIRNTGKFLLHTENRQSVDKDVAIIIVDKRQKTIQLQLNPEDYYGATITGHLEFDESLTAFNINKNKTFTKEEFIKLIKFNKIFFDNPDKHSELLVAFQKMNAQVNVNSTDGNDTRGNKERAFIKNVTTNIPTEFILNIPIFKGFNAIRFRVEICLDVTEGSARFWLESTELHEIVQKLTDEIFENEIKGTEGIVKIFK